LAATILAQDKPDTPAQAADEVLAAFKAKDQEALKALAEKDDADPWLVADELCFRGEHDAAEVFAKAAPRKDTEKLPAYVGSQRGMAPNTEARRALAAAIKALAEKDAKGALAAMEGVSTKTAHVVSIRLLHGRGLALQGLRRLEESVKAFRSAADAAERLGWLRRAADALHESGWSGYCRSDWRGAQAAWEHELALRESRGDRAGVARTLGNLGSIYEALGDYPKALEYQERSLKLEEELGNRAGVATALGNLGNIYGRLGDSTKALEYQERSLKLEEELGDRAGVAATLGNIGLIYDGLGEYPKALEYLERSLKLKEEQGDRAGVARTLGNIGNIFRERGDYPKALEYCERALKRLEELGDRAGVAATLNNLGIIRNALGDYPKALEYYERGLKRLEELGDRAGVAITLNNLGIIRNALGDYPKALEYYERGLKLFEELGHRAGVAATLGNIGDIYDSLGEYPKALEYDERALKLFEEVGHRAGVAATLGNIGNIFRERGDYARALEHYERSLKLKEELGDRAGMARTLGNIGFIHRCLGDHAKALSFHGGALKLAEELGSSRTVVMNLWGLALVHLARGEADQAVATAKRAVERMSVLTGGLAEEQGASLRGRFASVFDLGMAAAAGLEDAAETAFFLESGRAGTLLESLGGRDKLRATSLPEALLREEAEAQAAETVARKLYLRALDRGEREEVQLRRRELEQAREARKEVIEKIQREEKAAANVLYPKADSLEEIQASLRKSEALVLYALLEKGSLALVVTTKEARIALLGDTHEIAAACGVIRGGVLSGVTRGFAKIEQPDASLPGAITKLRKLVLEPLGLGRDVKRLLVSPHGALSYVPFALLAGDREVVQVPSGTTYRLLTGECELRGEGVLGLGDPDYETKVDATAKAVYRAGGRGALSRLPGTRAEVKALADVKLLGKDATEAGLQAALAQRARWHAVHLACHGLVDPERPTLSSLALTADANHDGFLSVLEVFRLKIPADLVVLSACETGKGKVVKGEGIVGMTRAFMFAGAPRVIVSLWKVDDAATCALMVKFYELWKPGKIATATALKKAQEYVRSHEKWSHPYYWAAWQLWGLPD
jgi:CHAT domain-containing protein/Tfp pilus assembly protein PilF